MIPPSLRGAARHLTTWPIPWDAREGAVRPSRLLPWFPAVGLGIGGCVWLALLLPLPPLVGAALALVVWTAATGGLHEDGLLDCADAAFATVPRARRLEILKDPHVGAHAVTWGGVLLLARFAGLASAPGVAVVVAAITGRWCMALTVAHAPPARSEGLGAAFARGARSGGANVVAAALLAGVAWTSGRPLMVAASAAGGLLAGAGACAFLVRRFGGATGDVHGASGWLAETAALVACAGAS